MASSYKEIPLTFEKGLVTEIEESILDTGQASELTNWEATPQGGLRARNAWEAITTLGLTAPYNVRGFGAIATGTAVAGAVTAPVVQQTEVWPNGDADPVATKTLTLEGVSIGNVLVAVVSEDSGLTPTVTVGWTQVAVAGTTAENYVKFYTKVATASSEPFTYTIATARLRALTLYELKYASGADPGSEWAVNTKNSGSPGTDNMTVNATDSDGGIALVGYHYDGGAPAQAESGTSGFSSVTQDNANTRVGVAFEDLDQLDGTLSLSAAANSLVYTTTSWTPPATGIIIMLFQVIGDGGINTASTLSVTGNGLTWNDCLDGGELGMSFSGSAAGYTGYAWADCSLVSPTSGAITVTVTSTAADLSAGSFAFVKAIGADTTDPFVQKAVDASMGGPGNDGPVLGSALQDGSGLLGVAEQQDSEPSATDDAPIAVIGAGNWEVQFDSFDIAKGAATWWNGNVGHHVYAWSSANNSPDTQALWTLDTQAISSSSAVTYEIRGQGNAAKAYHGSLTQNGTAIEEFDYVANKRMTAKMMVLGFTPPSVSADTVDFYIVLAVATDGTTYKVYRIPRDDITFGTWELLDSVTDSLDSTAFVTFAQGAGYLLWSSSTMNYPRSIELATLSTANVTDLLGLAGRTAVYHKDRMFVAGSSQNPSRVYFSDIGEPLDYTTTTDFLDIGGDDGEAIQDLLSVEGLLLIPKTNRAYLVSGSGVESFFVNELPGGTAATGRSAVRTPFGTVLAGTDDIWVVQGGGVDPMSRPLGAGYRITGKASTAYGQDTVLVCDSGSNTLWRVNLVTGAWSYEEVTGDDAANFIVWSLNGRLYYGCDDSTTQVGGTRQLLSPRNQDETSGDTHFSGATGRLALDGPAFNYTPRYLYLQTRAQDTDLFNELQITLTTNLNEDDPYETSIPVTEATQRDRISMAWAKGAEWLKVGFVANSSETASAIDVEKIVLGVDVEAPR